MNSAIILASGHSKRFKNKTPKQFHKINGRIILDYSVSAFSSCEKIHNITIVVPKDYHLEIKKQYPQHSVIIGGDNRRISSYKGLLNCHVDTKNVLIHDGARALIDKKTIMRCLEGLNEAEAISLILPAQDTIVETKQNLIVKMPNRNSIFLEQTPQGFHYKTILEAHKKNQNDTTDDIRLVYEMGIKCKTILGSEKNFKITTLQDYKLAKLILEETK